MPQKKIIVRQFILFAINGGILGIASWAAQLWIYQLIGSGSSLNYAISTAIIYPPFIIVNYFIQRHAIFLRKGCFYKFIAANFIMMGLVTVFSPICRWVVSELSNPMWGDQLGFVIAALMCAPLSFLFKRYWVFRAHEVILE